MSGDLDSGEGEDHKSEFHRCLCLAGQRHAAQPPPKAVGRSGLLGGPSRRPVERLPPGLQKVRHYGFLSPESNVPLQEVRALLAAQNTAAHDPNATVSRGPDKPSTSATTAITQPTCLYCGHRLRVVEILFHRVSFRDSG